MSNPTAADWIDRVAGRLLERTRNCHGRRCLYLGASCAGLSAFATLHHQRRHWDAIVLETLAPLIDYYSNHPEIFAIDSQKVLCYSHFTALNTAL
jgi:hypothetical protein